MITAHLLWLTIALICYCLTNSAVLTELLVRFGNKVARIDLLRNILPKTAASIVMVITLFYAIAKMFDRTSWLIQCIESVCLSTWLDRLGAQSISDQILFTFVATVFQVILLRIPSPLSRLTFFILTGASNLCAMIVVMLLAIMWPV